MEALHTTIREIRPDDDFELLRELIMETKRYAAPEGSEVKAIAAEYLKKWIVLEERIKGYVAEQGTEIVGFIGVEMREKHGVITTYGIKEAKLETLSSLVDACMQDINSLGGQCLGCFVHTEFGQIRNREIVQLERLGFHTSDYYVRVQTSLSLDDWREPDEIDTERVQAEQLELDDVIHLLEEDSKNPNSLIFRHQFRIAEPSNVFLTLRNDQHELTALAYYKVKRAKSNQEELFALAFNVHFVPRFELTRQEKKRFIQAVLLSMKQLDIKTVYSLMSMRYADTFTLLVQEGFDQIQNQFFALTKSAGEGR
ncbi:MAG: hypothetical protein K0Q59_2400 [Paenibacillus sp.]|jgi:N-acetylglutamate synthase-like GNAT family acetyltransferase|nr:hypothetical protein [Paenibacillus sp.]